MPLTIEKGRSPKETALSYCFRSNYLVTIIFLVMTLPLVRRL